ncbi:MAG TPA: DoxX-like family protein, partial [Usitatibacter sp.]|nr:DoxX-like family protein [Usitatibacter sp.]
QVQPVHVDDLVGAVVATVEKRAFTRERVAIVGPEPLGLRELLARLRLGLGLGRARFLRIPVPMVRLAAHLGVGLLDSDTLAMLERGNVAPVASTVALLGHAPRPVARFIAAPMRVAVRRDAALEWLLPLLRVSIAVVWLTAGIVSVGPYPVDESLALLARTGITGALAPAALFGAAALDFVLGVATLALPRRRLLWMVQIAVIVVYTAIITVALPEQWLHPYGPVVKNLPMLAAIVLLLRLEER